MIKILAFSGSGRKDSVNKKVVAVAAKDAEEAGAQVTIVNLEDFNMPIQVYINGIEKWLNATKELKTLKPVKLKYTYQSTKLGNFNRCE